MEEGSSCCCSGSGVRAATTAGNQWLSHCGLPVIVGRRQTVPGPAFSASRRKSENEKRRRRGGEDERESERLGGGEAVGRRQASKEKIIENAKAKQRTQAREEDEGGSGAQDERKDWESERRGWRCAAGERKRSLSLSLAGQDSGRQE